MNVYNEWMYWMMKIQAKLNERVVVKVCQQLAEELRAV